MMNVNHPQKKPRSIWQREWLAHRECEEAPIFQLIKDPDPAKFGSTFRMREETFAKLMDILSLCPSYSGPKIRIELHRVHSSVTL